MSDFAADLSDTQSVTAVEAVRGDALSQAQVDFVHVWSKEYFGHVTAARDLKKATVDWCLFLTAGGELVSHVALSEMSIVVGDQRRKAGAIGGLFTARPRIRRGFANVLMKHAETFTFRDLAADLGILFCLPQLVSFYARRGWRLVGTPVTLQQPGGIVTWTEAVMVLPPNGETWNEQIIHVPSQSRRSTPDIP